MKLRSAAALLAAAAVLGACSTTTSSSVGSPAGGRSSATQAPSDDAAVVIHTFAFGPQDLAVTAGTTVTWTNQDAILHTVTAGTPSKPGTAFDQQLDGVGSTASVTFDEPGTYRYHCSIHEVMQGVITVD